MIELRSKVLVVEDDEANRKLFGSLLREKGYDVFEAADGEEAVVLIQRESPALVLLDISLPKLNGSEVLGICRRKNLLDRTKVYALTGSEPKDILEAGFDGIIRKPIKVMNFLDVVEKTLASDERKEVHD